MFPALTPRFLGPAAAAGWACFGAHMTFAPPNPEALLSLTGLVCLGVKNSPQWPFSSFKSASLA